MNPDPSAAPPTTRAHWDTAYEIKAVGLLSLGFGLVGLDRFIINPLFPVMQKELGLNYQDLGLISAVLALTWGVASIFAGRLGDRIGPKRVLVPAIVVFSVLVASTGLASGMASLLLIRALMGLAEGAYVPASVVATLEASRPTRTGMNVGIQQMAAPLVGLGLGPVVAVALLKVMPSWHWVFAVVAVPGLLLAVVMARTLRDSVPAAPSTGRTAPFSELLRHRAVIVNAVAMACFLSCLITLAAFMPSYLVDHLHLGLDAMGLVLGALGAGSCVGMVAVPALSDRVGRKPVMLLSLAVAIGGLWLLPTLGAEPLLPLATALFAVSFMIAGVVAITVGPLTSAAVPAHMATSATGLVIGVGEIVGGALAPAVAGGLSQQFGITVVPQIALAAAVAGLLLVAFGMREPRPAAGLRAA
ncbi:MFS transporter [Ramlibacter sp. WS9]|uniref:MFS transporter n=1 Tax=Ramlibacter sp. WS9 TaxID=1882741 RepID=UPI0011448941|nr:MFS transporter [Ramlibacter sp. WS9]ROZ75057.1 MFS transporter [Ramlibacter sp. WS9]